jgi:hypothetical protein
MAFNKTMGDKMKDIVIEELAELKGSPLVEDDKNEEAIKHYCYRLSSDYEYYVWENMNCGNMVFNFQQWLIRNYDDMEEYNEIRFIE